MPNKVTGLSYSRNFQGFFWGGIVGMKQPKNQKVQGELKAMQLPLDLLSGCFSPQAK